VRRTALPWWAPAGVAAGALVLRTLGASWRLDVRGTEHWQGPGAERCIFALWHAQLLPLVYVHRGQGVVVLVSRHADGEWIARTIERLGYGTARGSSTRGGEEGMRQLMAREARARGLAITPDGPRGPARRVKPGLVWLASRSGLPIVPVAAAADRAHAFRSWDRFQVPLPFARVWVQYGAPLAVPAELDEAGRERWRVVIEQALDTVTRAVADRAGARGGDSS
jgi:lysophospholipid acyltransferase (LPLAT)-like uncharacterized protein